MKKFFNNVLHDRHGGSYVWPCVIILVLVMIFSVVLFYAEAMTIAETTRQNAETVMDSFIMKNSVEIYDSIKQGNDFTESFDESYFLSEYCMRFGLDLSENKVYNYDEQGQEVYYLTNPNVAYQVDDALKLKVSYTLCIPVRFAGKTAGYIKIPQVVKSAFTLHK